MSEDDNQTIEDHVQIVRKTQHDLTLKGDADEVGIIATNARKNEDELLSEKKKEKGDFYLNLILIQLEDYIEQLEEDIQRLKQRIEAMEKIEELIRHESFDLNNAEHIQLLNKAQITADQANSEILDKTLSDLRIELKEKEQDLIEAKKLKNEVHNNSNSYQVTSALQHLEGSDRGKIQSDILANTVDIAMASRLDEALGLSEEEQTLLAAAREGNGGQASNHRISFASSFEDNPIQANGLVDEFAKAHNNLKTEEKITGLKPNENTIKLGQP